jgi:hypothetical protein
VVPLRQLRRQAGNLTATRWVTTSVFAAAEQASNHCQIGNFGACLSTILTWVDAHTPDRQSLSTPSDWAWR